MFLPTHSPTRGEDEALTTEREALRRHNTEVEEKLVETEEDLAAARTSLRRMIRLENADPTIRM